MVKGYSQLSGIDYDETFAPVAKLSSFRLLLALSANRGWAVHQMDVVTAFLNPIIDEEVCMELPPGIDWLDSQVAADAVCTLKKALYRLKQSPRLW